MSTTESISRPSSVKRASLREQVADSLRAAVVTGQMKPGLVYSAPALAARFGVSSTPVREAMLDLAKQGLMRVVPNKGFQVTTLSETELDHITDIRLLLEPPAAALAARHARPDDVAELTPLAHDIVETAAARDLTGYIAADREFHGRLLALCGNDRLVHMIDELRDRTSLYEPAELTERGLLQASATEHLTMCHLMTHRDGPKLSKLMRAHINHVRGR